MKSKTKYECQCCGKPARYNFQKTWIVWNIHGHNIYKPGFVDNQDPSGEDNMFLCEMCAKNQYDQQYQLIQFNEWKQL